MSTPGHRSPGHHPFQEPARAKVAQERGQGASEEINTIVSSRKSEVSDGATAFADGARDSRKGVSKEDEEEEAEESAKKENH